MTLVVEKNIPVVAAPETIWHLLASPETWPEWWSGCIAANMSGTPRFGEGSKLELVLQPGLMKVTFNPEVDLFTEGKTLSLTERTAFVQSTVTWYLQPKEESTRVSVRGVFQGPFFFFMRILQKGDTPFYLLTQNLRGLRRFAERRGG